MFKRCFSPLTLVNQLALIVMLSTAIGVAGMAVSGWLVQGVQGSAHAINKAGSLRMQSYRLLAAVPLDAKDQKLLDEMEQTAFSPELTRAAERDGQQKQLKALQDYWHNELSPGLQHAQNAHAVAEDVTRFVAGLDRLVTSFDHTTELRIERVVLVHRVMAIFMALLLVFTIIWLRVRLCSPGNSCYQWRAPSVSATLPNVPISVDAMRWPRWVLRSIICLKNWPKVMRYWNSAYRKNSRSGT